MIVYFIVFVEAVVAILDAHAVVGIEVHAHASFVAICGHGLEIREAVQIHDGTAFPVMKRASHARSTCLPVVVQADIPVALPAGITAEIWAAAGDIQDKNQHKARP
eukprot:7377340-Prymnesium_polylepis.2